MRDDLPTGTVTFLFTDVEGSTKLLHSLGAEAYAEALAEHRRVIRAACAAEGGVEVDTQGDAFFFAFPTAPGALAAARALTESLAPGPIHVRVGLHTGTPLVTGEGYVGDDVHRAARIAAVGHGGQVLVAASTATLVGVDGLVDLGEHRFKDLAAPERVYQLGEQAFLPLRSLYRSNLPLAANPLIGRKKELADVLQALLDGSRAVTITGPGGVGKTRFALAVAGEAAEAFPDGVWFVPLAALRDPALVLPTVAEAIAADGDVARHIGDGACLLFLDNLEQVVDAAPRLGELAGKCPRLRLLVTSREAMRIAIEREYPLSPLPESPSVELFRQRLDTVAPELEVEYATAAAICDRLDRLPLAIELAAARCKALSPEQILARLSESLDLLRGGRDADPRQQTLRATIEWSYGLLSEEEQRLVRALSVFRGGCTLEAAEEVCGAELDTLQSLVEKSLLRFSGERYWMLETIREYARERLDEAAETAECTVRHGRWYLERLQANYPDRLGARHPEILAWYDDEEDNLRAMLDRLSDAAPIDAARAAYMLHFFWRARGAVAEEQERLRALLAGHDLLHQSRAALLVRLSDVDMHVGRVDASEVAAREALALAEPGTEPHYLALAELAFYSIHRGETEEAIRLGRQAAEEAELFDDASRIQAMGNLAGILAGAKRSNEARVLLERCVQEARRSGLVALETVFLAELGAHNLVEHDYESARAAYAAVLTQLRSSDTRYYELEALKGLGFASLGLGQRREARAAFAEMLELARATTRTHSGYVAEALSGIALAADSAAADRAARLHGAVAQLNSDAGVVMNAYFDAGEELQAHFERELVAVLGEEAWEREKAVGSMMTVDEAVAVATFLCDGSEAGVSAAS